MIFRNLLIVFAGICTASVVNAASVLRTDKTQYVLGDKIALIVSTSPLSVEDRDKEYVVESKIDSLPVRMIGVSGEEFVGVTQGSSIGTKTWEVKVYTQNKEFAKGIGSEVAMADSEIVKLRRLKKGQTNSGKIADLEAAILFLEQKKVSLRGQLQSSRALLETKTKSIEIVAAVVRTRAIEDSLVLNTYRPNNEFVIGESAAVYLDVVPSEFGSVPDQEADITAAFDSESVLASKTGEWAFSAVFPVPLVGQFVFSANLFISEKLAAHSLRQTVQKAGVRKVQNQILKESTMSPALALYYQSEIDDLNFILAALHGALSGLRTFAVNKTLSLNVVPPPPVEIDFTYIQLKEGVTGGYSIKLNNEPTGNVTVEIESALSSVLLSTDGSPSSASLILNFTTENWNTPQNVWVQVPENGVLDGERNTTIVHTISGGGYDNVQVPDVALTITDNVEYLSCTPNYLTMFGSWSTDSYYVSLPQEPVGDVTVTIDTGTGSDFVLNGGTQGTGTVLYFTPANWFEPQIVSVSLGFGEMGEGYYTFGHQVDGDPAIAPCSVEVYYSPF